MRLALWPDETAADHLAEMEEQVSSEGDRPTAVFVAAAGDGRLCGFVEVGTRPYAEGCDSSPVGFLEGWFVTEPLRGQGIGGRLVAAAEAWARKRGLTEFASDTWLHNHAGQAAHLALGFEEVERLVAFRKSLV